MRARDSLAEHQTLKAQLGRVADPRALKLHRPLVVFTVRGS